MIYLGLDIGRKRIGIAISESGILARPYAVAQNKDLNQSIDEIWAICEKEKVEKIIIGLPKLKSSSETTQTRYVRDFIIQLKQKIKTPVATVDEYLSSKEAERLLKEADPKITKNRRVMREKTDQMAAKLILEQYFNNNFK